MNPPDPPVEAAARAAGGKPPLDLHRWKLPRGRHGLPRELVARSQRERLLAAVVRVSASKGYQATSVADILKTAGVGRESFYKHFKDKEACFIAANDALVEDLESRVGAVYDEPGPWPERVRRGLAVILDWLAADPEIARVMMIEMGAVGQLAGERFQQTFARFTTRLHDGCETNGNSSLFPNIASIAGGAVFARVYEQVALDRATQLPELLSQLTFELLLPYIGEAGARVEQRKAEKDAAAR